MKHVTIAAAVALTMGTANANMYDVPSFPTLDSQTTDSFLFFNDAVGMDMDADLLQTVTIDEVAELLVPFFSEDGYTITAEDAIAFNNVFGGDSVTAGETFKFSIKSDNKFYNHGSGSKDLGNGLSMTVGHGTTDVAMFANGHKVESKKISNTTIGVSKVVWSDKDSAVVVGANYGTKSGVSLGASLMQSEKLDGGGMLRYGISAGHNLDSGTTGFGASIGADDGKTGLYGGFSLTDGLMSVGSVVVDNKGKRHNLTWSPVGILINLLMGNPTIFDAVGEDPKDWAINKK